MICRLTDLKRREVINIRDGTKYGHVSDMMLDTEKAAVEALIVYGKSRFFGLLGRSGDIVIRWEEIRMIGDDIVLADCKTQDKQERKRGLWSSFFED